MRARERPTFKSPFSCKHPPIVLCACVCVCLRRVCGCTRLHTRNLRDLHTVVCVSGPVVLHAFRQELRQGVYCFCQGSAALDLLRWAELITTCRPKEALYVTGRISYGALGMLNFTIMCLLPRSGVACCFQVLTVDWLPVWGVPGIALLLLFH